MNKIVPDKQRLNLHIEDRVYYVSLLSDSVCWYTE